MHFFLHEPILAGTVLLCLTIVSGLVLSDWAAKRRARNLLKIRDGLREQYRQQESGTPASVSVPTAISKPAFRIFRWEFAVVCVIAVFFLLRQSEKSLPVEAKSASHSISTNNAVLSSPSPTVEIKAAAQERAGATPVKVAASGKSPVTEGTASVSVDALFEHQSRSNRSIQDSEAELRKNYSAESGSFAPNGFDRGGSFPAR